VGVCVLRLMSCVIVLWCVIVCYSVL
jgi:hypothetical protein